MLQNRINEGDLTPEQRRILEEPGDVLVVGRPGTGKTSVALAKAVAFLQGRKLEEQSVLFLSFSNAAVHRILAAAKLTVPRSLTSRLSVTTFHAFCYGILASHARLVGMPRIGRPVLPHECRIIKAETQDPASEVAELARLERAEGRIKFERMLPLTLRLLRRHESLRAAYARAYPLIVVDEYQDTDDDQDELIDLLASPGQVVYLGDPDQRIYDFLPRVRADRFERLLERRGPTRIELPVTSHRSSGCDLVQYGRAVLAGVALRAKPRDVTVLRYGRANDFSKKLRVAILTAEKSAARTIQKGARPTLAVFGYRNTFVERISDDLCEVCDGFQRPFAHKLHTENDDLLPAWMLVLAILGCPEGEGQREGVSEALRQLGRHERSQDGKARKERGAALLSASDALRGGNPVRPPSLGNFAARVPSVVASFDGDCRKDIARVIDALRATKGRYFERVLAVVDRRSPADGPKEFIAQLAEARAEHGDYRGASALGEDVLLRERLLGAEDRMSGRSVMTLHKAKGKEFDAVVIVDGPAADGLLLPLDPLQEKSRRLLNMAITRARKHVVILTPVYAPCPLLPSWPVAL